MNYWDKEYPTHIEVPKNYWVVSCNVEYIENLTLVGLEEIFKLNN